jgi:hypothetical protein
MAALALIRNCTTLSDRHRPCGTRRTRTIPATDNPAMDDPAMDEFIQCDAPGYVSLTLAL